MALPTLAKTWIISPNNRIVFVSLLDTMQRYLFGVKAFLKLNGYTVKGSASAGVGAMDAVDRWTTSATVTPRATVAAASQAWIVLIDGNGCNILLTYQGASDDIARISFSPGGLFVAAGTPQNQPTATDEQVVLSGTSLINATASADRLWNGWVDSTSKLCRFAVARSGVWTGQTWGVELATSACTAPAVFTPPVWGFGMAPAGNAFTNQTTIGIARIVVASVAISALTPFMMEWFFGVQSLGSSFGTIQPEAQGAAGYAIFPMSIASRTVGATGKVAALIDWWQGRSDASDGDTYGTLQFLVMNLTSNGVMWPWDGVTTPVLT